MDESQLTQPSLLIRVRDARDGQAWSQFVHIYSPLVYRYARRRGLQDADAADVTQDVLQTVARAIGRFDWAAEQVRGEFQDSTWQAFWQTNVDGKDTKEVARSLGMTVGAVYIARSRVLARLKKQIEQVKE